jgi:hypothetical protein
MSGVIETLPIEGNNFMAFAKPRYAVPATGHLLVFVQKQANPMMKFRLFPAAVVKRIFVRH